MNSNIEKTNLTVSDGTGQAIAEFAGTQTVRRYAMTKKSRKNWLRRYMNISVDGLQEEEEKLTSADIKRRKHKAKGLFVILLIALAAAVAFPLVSLVLSQLTVKTIEISGQTRYAANELCDAAGINEGDKLFGFDREKAAAEVLEKLPYLKSCDIKIKLNGEVTFTVSSEKALIYTEVDGEFYALSSGLKVLERSKTATVFVVGELIYTELPDARETVVGNKLIFAEPEGKEYITDIISSIAEGEMFSDFTRLFLDNKYDIVGICNGRYCVKIGSPSDIDIKLAMAQRVMETSDSGDVKSGIVDVTSPGSASFLARIDFNPNERDG